MTESQIWREARLITQRWDRHLNDDLHILRMPVDFTFTFKAPGKTTPRIKVLMRILLLPIYTVIKIVKLRRTW